MSEKIYIDRYGLAYAFGLLKSSKLDTDLSNLDAEKLIELLNENGVGGSAIVTTEGTGAAYTATVPGIDALTTGVSFTMIPHITSTAVTPTLNVNGLGAINMHRRLSSNVSSVQIGYNVAWIMAGKPIEVMYDGTFWIVMGQEKPSTADLSGTVSIEKGGTGATTAAAARENLGAAASDHTHSEYAPVSHTHSQYAAVGHTHSEYAVSDHKHDEYAASDHTHSEYAAANHTHAQSDITGLATVLSGKADTNHSHSNATTNTAGYMSPADKSKLDGIAAGANKYTHPTYPEKSSGLYKVTVDATGHVSATSAVVKGDITALGIPGSDTTYSAATTSTAGLMSAADKSKLDGIASGANNITVDSALSSTSTNPVQNKVINTALAGKAASSHTHSEYAPKYSYGTEDLVAGTSPLATGTLYFVYE